MSERECKYPDCVYYSPKAKTYCCVACSCDHTDYIRLGRDLPKAERDKIEYGVEHQLIRG